MTRDDIIRMAREAGYPDYVMGLATEAAWSQVLHFAALVAAEKDKEIAALKEERRRDMAEIRSLRESEESLREENERLREELRQSSIDHTRAEVERLRKALRTETARCAKVCIDAADRYRDAGWDGEATALRDAARQMLWHDETAIWAARHDPRE